MRLVESMGAEELPHDVFGRRALEDMRVMYGGEVNQTNVATVHMHSLNSKNENVSAYIDVCNPLQTYVTIANLDEPQNAASWTALQAYRARGGVEVDMLRTEVPGVRGHQEWTNRQSLQNLTIDETAPFFTMPAAGSKRGLPTFFRAPTSDALHTHTVFHAFGPSLPEAARVMSAHYGELFFHSDDPDEAVAGALGVKSLDQLDDLWEQAMSAALPLSAGRLVLRALVQ